MPRDDSPGGEVRPARGHHPPRKGRGQAGPLQRSAGGHDAPALAKAAKPRRATSRGAGGIGVVREGFRSFTVTVLLDTHVWLWWLTEHSPLTAKERQALDRAAGQRELALSAISMWEAQI